MPSSSRAAPAILIVEDDADLLQAIGFSFEMEGFEVHTFESGEALLAETSLPSRGCLILDEHLPGANGLDVLKTLRSRGVDLPAVLITTAYPALRIRAEDAGVAVVEKPLLANALIDAVDRQLAAPQA